MLILDHLLVLVKHENFKTCDQSGFCKRNRAYADEATSKGSSWTSPYILDQSTISVNQGQLKGIVSKSVGDGAGIVRLPLTITFLDSGVARVTVDEEKRQKGDIDLRHGSVARKERYDEVSKWALVGGLNPNQGVTETLKEDVTVVKYGPDDSYQAVVHHSPFGIDFFRGDQIHVKLNGKGFLNYEHWRPKVEKENHEGEGNENTTTDVSEDESTWWEETFGGNTDSKPKGPESVGVDITFPGYEHVFGIPGHTGPLSLKQTRYDFVAVCAT